MPQSSGTFVIGAGLLGIASAYELATRGEPVTILEARPGVAMETSFANGGLLTASMSDPWNAPGVHKHLFSSPFNSNAAMKLRIGVLPSMFLWGMRFLANATVKHYQYATKANYHLAAYSVEATRQLRVNRAISYNGAPSGALKLFRNEAAMRDSLAMARLLEPFGLRFELLDRNATIQAEPQLEEIRNDIVAALYFPDDECGDAHLFCCELLKHIRCAGGSIVTGLMVQRLIAKRGRIVGIDTDQGVMEAERVVVAAGTQSPALLRTVGLSLPVRPAKGYSATFAEISLDLLPRIPVIDDQMHAGVVRIGDRLRVVGTAEFAGFDKRIRQERIDNLFNMLAALFPRIWRSVDANKAETWAGLRPMSVDGLPYIGPAGIAGLYLNTGHGHLGWTMAVGSAKLLADLMQGRPPATDPAPYRFPR